MALLAVRDLSVSFGALRAVDGVSLAVERGQIVGLIGPNGAGKSTVFNCISRFYRPDKGEIEFDGQNLLALRADQVLATGIARTFQNIELVDGLSAEENILVGRHLLIETSVWGAALRLGRSRRSESQARLEVRALADLLGLERWIEHRVVDLPYGIRKRVEIARALIGEPRLLLLDEPAAGLHASDRDGLAQIIRRIGREMGIAVLLVDHDMRLMMPLCEYLYVMSYGSKIAEGPPEDMRRHPEVVAAYLGSTDDESEN